MTVQVAKHSPIPESTRTKLQVLPSLSAQGFLPNLIQTTVALYSAINPERDARCSSPAKDHTSFSLFALLFYTHPAEIFSGQEGPELINNRERWSLKF